MADQDPYAATAVKPAAKKTAKTSVSTPAGDPYAATAVQAKAPASVAPYTPPALPSQEGFLASAKAPFVDALKALIPHSWKELGRRATPGVAQYDAVKNMLVMPAIDQGEQAIDEFKQANAATPWYSFNPSAAAVEHRELGGGHALAALIPVLGPWAAQVGQKEGEQIGTGNYKGAAGTAVGNAALALAPKVAGEAAAAAPEAAQSVVRRFAGTGSGVARDLVQKVTEDNRNISDKNALADKSHAVDVQNALHETQGRELQHQQDVKQAEENAKNKTVEARRKYITDRQAAAAKNQEAAAARQTALAKQAKIGSWQTRLQTAWRSLLGNVETARAQALKTGNAKYNGVNGMLDPIQADPETSQKLYSEASEGVSGDKMPSLLKEFGDRIRHSPLTYDDHAYDLMHEGIGKEMQSIAARYDEAHGLAPTIKKLSDGTEQRVPNPQGAEAALSQSRNYWRRMKQTFGKALVSSDSATKALKTSAPDVAAANEQANRIRLLGGFDPRIPQVFNHIRNIQKGIDALPEQVSPRQVVQQFAKAYQPPGSIPRPGVVEPEPVKPVERVAPPDRPEPKPSQKISIEDMQRANEAAFRSHGHGVTTFLMRRAAIWPVIRMLSDLTRTGTTSLRPLAAIPAAGSAGMAVETMLEHPGVREFFTKATRQQVAQIPPDLRGAMPDIVAQAKAQGVQISPVLAAYAAAIQRNRKQQPAQSTQPVQPVAAGAAQ
jgi:hypothetical protein